ncbi:MAG: aspartate--ammonia ligase [Candidatus Marinimicrobia bacterium]|nr:aspartate--ammonia ligase [Candidatus Neomarinimicrobiota bacterium]MCF7827765.1 aspartate--ammonia ligase [Candidatus Neomarinimicrobiota bacterium]MCF7879480.1 aspartate--ammonia ligase [Candidatus Neomarinimicrobiota bacterium]
MTTESADDGRLHIPKDYTSALDLRATEEAIKFIKDTFQENIAEGLSLSRISAPIMVLQDTGINDHLSGTETPVTFDVPDIHQSAEIVQSLAKWKRLALADYGFEPGEGLYTDMNAIRPDETLDNLHSIYVDQWDWELVMHENERTVEFLQEIVREIYAEIVRTERRNHEAYPALKEPFLPDEITFIHTEELAQRFPNMSPKEREIAICKKHGAVFLRGIGADLEHSGQAHDNRAADYDDWTSVGEDGHPGLNGDILVWYPVLNRAFEISSMGIRVNPESLRTQLELKGELEKQNFYFHKRLLNGELPQTIGGGIGQSRLCMLMLRKAHVGEVHASIWPEEMRVTCEKHGMQLL